MVQEGFQMVDEADFLEEIERFEGEVFYEDYRYGISGGNEKVRFLFYPWVDGKGTKEEVEQQEKLTQEFETAEEMLGNATFPDGKTIKEVLHLVYFGYR